MVSLLIVSHSEALAEGVRALAQQMAPDVPIYVAGGTDDGSIGTSFEKIVAGLEAAGEGGVLVLMDLGSAVMTTETALDFLDEGQRARVRLSDAPLVEGALAAATTAAGGGDLDAVARAASETRLLRKLGSDNVPDEPERPGVAEPVESRRLSVVNPAGLHARPAAQLIQALLPLDAQVALRNLDRAGRRAAASSLVGVLGLDAQQGHTLEAEARGPDARVALDTLETLVAQGFGEMEAPPAPRQVIDPSEPPGAPGELRGIAAAPGVGVGVAFPLAAWEPELADITSDDPGAEWARLEEALEAARQVLVATEQQSASQVGASEAAIFGAQRLLLDDPVLLQRVRVRIAEQRETAARAWQTVLRDEAEALRATDSPLIAERAADLLDVGRRVLRYLVGEADVGPVVPPGTVVLAHELTPSDLPVLKAAGIAGLATETGGPTSHAAILARAMAVPAVVGVGPVLREVQAGVRVVLDGTAGRLLIDPSESTVERVRAQAQEDQDARATARKAAHAPAQTRDGRRLIVAANVASVEEAEAAVAQGAEGIGLLRTEFLFLGQRVLPSEDEQVEALRRIFAPMGDRPIIVRTLDVGGDKPLPALDLDPTLHSFLGVRGLRYHLRHPELFRQQLRTILRAADGYRVSVMFPMVTTVEELRAARQHLAAVEAVLGEEGVAWGVLEEVGAMVEVPAAALAADQLAAEVDFFSVGSNDLVQYTMAADRTSEGVAALYRPSHPAVLRLLRQLVEQAHAQGCWVGICGEMAGDPAFTPLLVGLGVDELSMVPAAIPAVKAAVRALTVGAARGVLDVALG